MSALLKPDVPAVDLTSARAAGAALRTFFRLADAWQLSVAEQTTLLGVARTTLYQWKQGKVAPLDRHLLERLSHLFGIYSSLQILFPATRRADAVKARIPSGRIGVDDDMAGAAIYLASRAGDYVVGSTMVVDGGVTHSR